MFAATRFTCVRTTFTVTGLPSEVAGLWLQARPPGSGNVASTLPPLSSNQCNQCSSLRLILALYLNSSKSGDTHSNGGVCSVLHLRTQSLFVHADVRLFPTWKNAQGHYQVHRSTVYLCDCTATGHKNAQFDPSPPPQKKTRSSKN